MNSTDIRQWLDGYGAEVGYGCLYCEDISCAAGCIGYRSIKYVAENECVLFNEKCFQECVNRIKDAVIDTEKNHLGKFIETYGKAKGIEKDNIITHIILHGAKATGGFGIWVVRLVDKELERIINNEHPFVVAMAVN